MPKIRDTSVKAPSGWWLCDPDTKVYLSANSYKNLRATLLSHRKANNLSVDQIDAMIAEVICKREHPDFCSEWPTGKANFKAQKKLSIPIWQIVGNFASAMTEWAAHGFPVVDEADFLNRLNICRKCEYWDEKAMGGLAKCNKCGCTDIKLHLGTSKCPIRKW